MSASCDSSYISACWEKINSFKTLSLKETRKQCLESCSLGPSSSFSLFLNCWALLSAFYVHQEAEQVDLLRQVLTGCHHLLNSCPDPVTDWGVRSYNPSGLDLKWQNHTELQGKKFLHHSQEAIQTQGSVLLGVNMWSRTWMWIQ